MNAPSVAPPPTSPRIDNRSNWFVAFPIDGAVVDRLPPAPSNVRVFHRDDVHNTVAFLGACGEERALRAWARLLEHLDRKPLERMSYSLGEVVPLRSRHAFSALSALLAEGRRPVEAAMLELRGVCFEGAGLEVETRPALAHVTVARPSRRASASDREAALRWAEKLELRDLRGQIDRVALYTWSDARHERLFRIVEHALARDSELTAQFA